jgi:hypothetical protein
MPSLVLNCPHCDTVKAGFTYRGQFPCSPMNTSIAVPAVCNVCNNPIVAVIKSLSGMPPDSFGGDLLNSPQHYFVEAVYPEGRVIDTPSDIPGAVANAFNQAAGSRRAGHFDAACAMYRKAMELSLKAFSPDIEAWQIEKRINKMAAANKITPELQAWAHELRLDGNEAVHGDEEATADMTDQMHEFCRFLLIYLYTLPAQVEAAQVRRMLG